MNAAADIRARLPNSSRLWSRLALAFILLLGAVRLAVIGCCAPLVPFWDEWTATANLILKPWHESRHVSWSMLWAPHNDHRIVLTRLWEIGWFTILGEWDPTFVATINALILAAAQAGFVIWIGHRWHTRARLLWMLVAGALLVVPFGYANLLVAFQSQFHFLTALGLIALVAAVRVEDSRWGAPIAITASAFALFSTGAGLLVALAVGCLAVLQTVVRRRVLPRTAVLWACSIVIFVAGWRIRPPPTFGPATFARTALATTRYAGWPASNLANLIAGWPESVR